ncbi:asparagine synthase (glutamine-hydrolyzing) [Algoriphagus kandeliae]|uniref:asparagine synthase (glutamine-hydrolyzing) n=1 Tax=Algoriphagus kandeliae TaxID=2562278 RepID=A0A4Y9QXJ8_9BACT|nr:asparagine synthase (glutamine-hydrolyzing) [Algoriphagus kandeliae]TFV95695.1 asparagine synthase (glutamine-hydrolyzing) [Algoriphagus kandeliae]
MCGIHVVWGKGANEEALNVLMDSAKHRGPDQEDKLSPWPGIWIGVNRLKILHPGPEADQPFWSPDGNHLLIWNGEIYNYQDLRNLLLKMGVEFFTRSDTEVLLHWLKIFGTAGLEKLQGMFALVFVDLSAQNILVARDKNGEKPLYYHQTHDSLFLSSESRGIAKLIGSAVDMVQVEYFHYLRTPQPGKTFFKGVKEWKPARFSLIRDQSAFRWDDIPKNKTLEKEKNQNRFTELLKDAVLKQFHADVPLGMLLSGGSDSTLLYALWYYETGVPLPAFTAQFEKAVQKKYDDGLAVKRLHKKLPFDQVSVEVNRTIFRENWEDYLQNLDYPVGDSASFLVWLIGKKAKESVKVLISGAGADELWGGYQRHKAFHTYLKNQGLLLKIPSFVGKLPFGRNWNKFFSGIDVDPRKTFLNFSALETLSSDLFEDYERVFRKKLPLYKQMLDFDRQIYLVQDILKIQDNALMAHGIEGRSPYLDQEMMNFWEQIENEEDLIGKKWIRQSLQDLELGWVADRKKLGFGLPLLEWLSEKNDFSSWIFSTVQEFEINYRKDLPEATKTILSKPQDYVRTHFLTIYNFFLLAEWLKLQKP